MGTARTYAQAFITDYFDKASQSAAVTQVGAEQPQVRQMQPGETEVVRQILKNWKMSATILQSQVKPWSSDYFRLDSVIDLTKEMRSEFKDPGDSRVHLCVSRCASGVETIHSVGVSDIDLRASEPATPFMELRWLVTDPAQMRIELNRNKPGRISGNASMIIRHLAQECFRKRYLGIVLDSTDSAKGFYKKLGFKRKTVDFNGRIGISHKLSLRRIQKQYPEVKASRQA